MEEPKYYGSWKGRIIEGIVKKGATMDWNELLNCTELSPKSLNRAIAELRQISILTEKNGQYKVSPEIWKEYKEFYSQETTTEDKMVEKATLTIKGLGKAITDTVSSVGKQKDVKSWINDWKALNNLNIPMESRHFFLEGKHLDSISQGLIQHAKNEILIVNPFVESCNLSNAILDARKKGVKVSLITRQIKRNDRNRFEKQEYLDELKQSGVSLSYKGIHAKLIVVDHEVAIVSSMNFMSSSSGGSTWEAGVVSLEGTVVKSVVDSITNL